MARAVSMSEATVRRIWHKHGLKPHVVKTFKLSNDPQCIERLEDIVGLYLIADNYATHKHPRVQSWLKRHPRFHMHFTPTSASWLNMVERFFRDLTDKCIRRGVFHSVKELVTTIIVSVEQHNKEPKPFIWTAKASDILEKVKRGRAASINDHLCDALHYYRKAIPVSNRQL